MTQLFDGQSADGDSTPIRHYGGPAMIYVDGSLGGGTIEIRAELPDGSTDVPLDRGQITAPGAYLIDCGPFAGVLRLSGSTGASVSAWYEADTSVTDSRVYDR